MKLFIVAGIVALSLFRPICGTAAPYFGGEARPRPSALEKGEFRVLVQGPANQCEAEADACDKRCPSDGAEANRCTFQCTTNYAKCTEQHPELKAKKDKILPNYEQACAEAATGLIFPEGLPATTEASRKMNEDRIKNLASNIAKCSDHPDSDSCWATWSFINQNVRPDQRSRLPKWTCRSK